jgi:hypothetical protein
MFVQACTGPLPHPATHDSMLMGGRVGERAGADCGAATHSNRPIMGQFETLRREMGHAAMQYSRSYIN